MKKDVIIIIGACGQIGRELTMKLRIQNKKMDVIACDLFPPTKEILESGPFLRLNVLDKRSLSRLFAKYQVKEMYLLAATLSAEMEKSPVNAWDLNIKSLQYILDAAKNKMIDKIFWPSSISIFGASSPKINTPQKTIIEPVFMYGISKYTGEMLGQYYHLRYGVDFRSIRFPGLISWKGLPGGGTTDFAIHMLRSTVSKNNYECFLKPDTVLPLMHMEDALYAIELLMNADPSKIKQRMAYNIMSFSASPKMLLEQIKEHFPGFIMQYKPDYRQAIADSWPRSLDDTLAKEHWNWKASFSLGETVIDMLKNLSLNNNFFL